MDRGSEMDRVGKETGRWEQMGRWDRILREKTGEMKHAEKTEEWAKTRNPGQR